MEQIGGSMVADSPDEVRLRVREQLMQGASQIKLTAGGGVASPYSPLDVVDLHRGRAARRGRSGRELGHLRLQCTPTRRPRSSASIAAGVKCIEHGHLMDEATARLMAEKGIWLSTQPFLDRDGATRFRAGSDRAGEDAAGGRRHRQRLRAGEEVQAQDGVRAPTSCSPQALAQRQGALLAKLDALVHAGRSADHGDITNAELLALSGLRNPYPGKLGVVEEGALADLLLVDGNPLANIDLVADPDKNFVVIMKDGKIYKNTISK